MDDVWLPLSEFLPYDEVVEVASPPPVPRCAECGTPLQRWEPEGALMCEQCAEVPLEVRLHHRRVK